MELSARNQLEGEVVAVKSGSVMAEVEVRIKPIEQLLADYDLGRLDDDRHLVATLQT